MHKCIHMHTQFDMQESHSQIHRSLETCGPMLGGGDGAKAWSSSTIAGAGEDNAETTTESWKPNTVNFGHRRAEHIYIYTIYIYIYIYTPVGIVLPYRGLKLRQRCWYVLEWCWWSSFRVSLLVLYGVWLPLLVKESTTASCSICPSGYAGAGQLGACCCGNCSVVPCFLYSDWSCVWLT